MDEARLTALLEDVATGRVDIAAALQQLRHLPFQQVGDFATLDTHRAVRTGHPEVIYCAGKTTAQIRAIVEAMLPHGGGVMATRMDRATATELDLAGIRGRYHELARMFVVPPDQPREPVGQVVICSAGTSDLPVAEEAAVTAEALGSRVERMYDVGVAGLHRLLHRAAALQQAQVVVVVAGMEGALASVVGGLIAAPVVAVPTSVGYGANFGGLAPLLTMLNSCATGVAVVNIDNGFGGGYYAHVINAQSAQQAEESRACA
jgi:NCAIR mutase (PurE)-related protein